MTDQRELRMAFDSAADLYQEARPGYPEQLCEAMIAAAGIGVEARLLEIGCASGKATLPLVRRAFASRASNQAQHWPLRPAAT